MIYLASPGHTSAQQQWNSSLANNLRAHGHEVCQSRNYTYFTELYRCDTLVLNCDWPDPNSALEFGLAVGREKLTVAFCTRESRVEYLAAPGLADAFVHIPLGGYSEISRAVLGHIQRLQNA